MEKEISLSSLEKISKEFGIRIWTCKKIGRRWAFLHGAGVPEVLPAELIYETENFGIFVQGINFDAQKLKERILQFL